MAVEIRVQVLWVMTPCNVMVGYQQFGGLSCLHLQHYVPKRWYTTTILHGVITKNTST